MAKEVPEFVENEDFKEGIRTEQYILTQKIEDLFKKPQAGIPDAPKERKAVNTDMENQEVFTPKPQRLVYLDIETYMDQSLKEEYMDFKAGGKMGNRTTPAAVEKKKEENRAKFALSPLTGEIILSGILTDDDKGKSITQIGLNGATEKLILTETAERLEYYFAHNYKLVTYNGREFDIPYIYFRCAILGLNVNLPPMRYWTGRYNDDMHFDMYKFVGEGSLAEWTYRLGFSTDFVNDGKNIADYFFNKQYDIILKKNAMDLKLLHAFYKTVEKWL